MTKVTCPYRGCEAKTDYEYSVRGKTSMESAGLENISTTDEGDPVYVNFYNLKRVITHDSKFLVFSSFCHINGISSGIWIHHEYFPSVCICVPKHYVTLLFHSFPYISH